MNVLVFIFLSSSISFAGEISIVSVGDIYLGGEAAPYLKQDGGLYPFKNTADILKESDITIGNLESPFTDSDEVFVEKKFTFKTDAQMATALNIAGFDVLTLANNHIMDFGSTGLGDTITALKKNGILYTGAGHNLKEARAPAVYEKNGVKVGVLAYSKTFPDEFYARGKRGGTNPGFFDYVKKDIELLKRSADIVIVAFHWGAEYVKEPKAYQQELAHLAIESGAILVLGHHPHVVQPVEVYKQGLIFYSLGNFVFGTYSPYGPEGMMAKVTFERKEGRVSIKDAAVALLDVENTRVNFSPVILQGQELSAAMDKLGEASKKFNAAFVKGSGGVWNFVESFNNGRVSKK